MDLSALKASIYSDFDQIPKRELLMFYGDNGSGKTKLAVEVACDITPTGYILYVDTSAGYETINNHPELRAMLADRLKVLPFVGEDQLNTLADAIRYNREGFGIFKTVILDESSSMAQHYLDTVVEARCRNDRTKEQDKADWPDYNIAGNKWRKTVQKFQQIQGVSFIEVCHQRSDTIRKVEFISPAFQPTVGNETRKEKRVIAYCDIRQMAPAGSKEAVPTRIVQTEKDDHVLAKTRVMYQGKPLPTIVTPEMMRQAIREDYENRITNHEPVEVD